MRALGFAAAPILFFALVAQASSCGSTASAVRLVLTPFLLAAVFVAEPRGPGLPPRRDHRRLPGRRVPQRVAASGDGRLGRPRLAAQAAVGRRPARGPARHGRQPRRRRPLRHAGARPPRQRLHLHRRRPTNVVRLDASPSPGARRRSPSRRTSPTADRPTPEPPAARPGAPLPDVVDPAVGRQGAAEHPPHRHRPAAERGHLQHRHADRRLDRPDDEAGRDVQPATRHGRRPDAARARPNAFGAVYPGRSTRWFTPSAIAPTSVPGNEQTRGYNGLKAILGNLYGLDIKYFVEVNFDGFRQVVDAIGGVTINVQIPVLDDRYPGDDGPARGSTSPPGSSTWTGAEALATPVAPRLERLRPRRAPAARPALAPRAGRPAGADPAHPGAHQRAQEGGPDRHPGRPARAAARARRRRSTRRTSAPTCSRRRSTGREYQTSAARLHHRAERRPRSGRP